MIWKLRAEPVLRENNELVVFVSSSTIVLAAASRPIPPRRRVSIARLCFTLILPFEELGRWLFWRSQIGVRS